MEAPGSFLTREVGFEVLMVESVGRAGSVGGKVFLFLL